MARARRYYDPATKPYPRSLPPKGDGTVNVAKDSRQQRRARERELKKQQPHTHNERENDARDTGL